MRRLQSLRTGAVAVAAAALLMLPSAVLAQSDQGSEQSRMNPSPQMMPGQFHPDLMSTRDINGRKVVDVSGEQIGTVKHVELDATGDNVSYVLVQDGTFLGQGAQGVVIPFPALKWETETVQGAPSDQGANPTQDTPGEGTSTQGTPTRGAASNKGQGRFMLDVARDPLKSAPTYTKDTMPNLSDPGTRQKVDGFYSQASANFHDYLNGAGAQPTSTSSNYIDASKLKGWKVTGLKDKLGSLNGVALDMASGRPVYGIVNHSGFWGLGSKDAVVPWQALTLNIQQQQLFVNVSRAELDGLRIGSQGLNDPALAMNAYRAFNMEPYWVSYGYAAPSSPGQTMEQQQGMERQSGTDRQQPSGQRMQGEQQSDRTGVQEIGDGAWTPNSTYNGLYDPTTVRTITGKVVSTDKFRPTPKASEGLEVMLRTQGGQTFDVQFGPTWFTDKAKTMLKKGDELTVMGSMVTMSGKEIMLARQVSMKGRTFSLRDEQGRPLWSEQGKGSSNK